MIETKQMERWITQLGERLNQRGGSSSQSTDTDEEGTYVAAARLATSTMDAEQWRERRARLDAVRWIAGLRASPRSATALRYYDVGRVVYSFRHDAYVHDAISNVNTTAFTVVPLWEK